MIISDSSFENFPTIGAIVIELDNTEIEVIGSIFTNCNNDKPGGALRLIISTTKCELNRSCASYCHTNIPDNSNDYGQFAYVKNSKNIHSSLLSISFCPERIVSQINHGAITFESFASLSFKNSNSSNNYCSMGSGAYLTTNSATFDVSYIQCSNDTSITNFTHRAIAICFNYDSGHIDYCNFDHCSSKLMDTKQYGTYNNCYFYECPNYVKSYVTGSGNSFGSSLDDFYYPKTCLAIRRERSEKSQVKNHMALWLTSTFFKNLF